MLKSALIFAVVIAIVVSLVTWFGYFYKKTSDNERELFFSYLVAKTNLSLLHTDAPVVVEFRYPDGSTRKMTPSSSRVIDEFQSISDYVYSVIKKGTSYSLYAFFGVVCLLLLVWRRHGRVVAQDEFIRGAEIIESHELACSVQARKEESSITIGGVPTRSGAEMLNFLITGAIGSGKSVAISEMLDQVRLSRKKSVVYDPTGEFTEVYFRPGIDVVLNPFDERSPNWNIWNEVRADYDYASLAAGLIPDANSSDGDFFNQAARVLFRDLCRRLKQTGQTSNKALFDNISKELLSNLYEKLKGTGAAAFVDPAAEKTAASIRMTALNSLNVFQYLRDDGELFSIREWIERNDDSWLFLTSKSDLHEAVKPILTLWIDIIIRAVMTLPPTREPRLWCFLDELPSLDKVNSLSIALTQARKFGFCSVLGIQSVAQLDEIYGEKSAQVFLGMCQTWLTLRVADSKTAEYLSKTLGECEIQEKDESLSFGAQSIRDGVSLQSKRNKQAIVLPSEIIRLPDLIGFLKLPGDYPVAKIGLKIVERARVNPAFVEREFTLGEDDWHALDTTTSEEIDKDSVPSASKTTVSVTPYTNTLFD